MKQANKTLLALAMATATTLTYAENIDNIVGNTTTKNKNDFGEYGIWSGEIYNFATTELEGDSSSFKSLTVANCGKQPYIFIHDKQGKPNPIYAGAYQLKSYSNNTIMSLIASAADGGWVETQNWSFISKSNNNLVVQWSRQVSNPTMDNNERLRAFGEMGYGEISKQMKLAKAFLKRFNPTLKILL